MNRRNIYFLFILYLYSTVCGASSHVITEYDDWIVNHSCVKGSNKLCHGYYQEPFYSYSNPNMSTDKATTITSDKSELASQGISIFTGNVIAKQGDKTVYADKVTVVRNDKTGELETIIAEGHVKLIEPGVRVDGVKATNYLAQDYKIIEQAKYRLYQRHGRGEAETIEQRGPDKILLKKGGYTTCPPGNNTWYLKSRKTIFNRSSGRGESWHSTLYLQSVPLFYWPYVNFPIDDRRKTGFLQPSIGNSTENGRQIVLPFYWNIAPNYDATFVPHYMSHRGLKLDNTFRYLMTHSRGEVHFDFLPNDRGYRHFRSEMLADSTFANATDSVTKLRKNDLKSRDFRYRVVTKNHSNLDRHWFFDLDYTAVSDGSYFYDFGRDIQDELALAQPSSTHALQKMGLQYRHSFGTLGAQLEQYQTLHPAKGPTGVEQLRKLPEIGLSSDKIDLFYGISSKINSTYTQFRSRLVQDDLNLLTYGKRLHIRPAFSRSFKDAGWFVIPRVQLNHVNYNSMYVAPVDLTKGVHENHSSLTIPMYDVKTGLIFERGLNIGHKSFIQTLEPMLYYLRVPDKFQEHLPNFDSGVSGFDYNQIFRDNRYGGLDRVSEANQLGVGVSSKFFANATGDERMTLGIGRLRYFRDRTIRLGETTNPSKHWSPLAMTANVRFAPEWSLDGNLVRESHVTRTGTINLQYKPSSVKVLNLGYQFNRNDTVDALTQQLESHLKQLNISGAWELIPELRVLGRLDHDLRFHRHINVLMGLEYHTCCSLLRVVWTKNWRPSNDDPKRYDHQLRLQLVFKGFSGFGQADSSFVSSKIPGYVAGENKF